MRITDRLVSATELNRNSSEVLARASAGARLLVVKDNRPIAAIVPLDDLDRLEDLDETSSAADMPGGALIEGEPRRQPVQLGTWMKRAARAEELDGVVADHGNTLIGQSASGELVQLQLAANTLIVGATGSGKTATLSAMLSGAVPAAPIRFLVGTARLTPPQMVHTPSGVLLWVLAMCVDLGSEPTAATLTDAVHLVIGQRRNRFRDAGIETIAEYRRAYPDSLHENADVIVILDEPECDRSGALNQLIVDLLRCGPDLGIFLWLLTQRATGRESSFPQRIAHRTTSRDTSRMVVNTDKAKFLQIGEAFLAIDNQDTDKAAVTRFQVVAPNAIPYRLGTNLQDDYESLQAAVVAET
ncbi:DNA segregation ATPase FtsK/SpoIIIE and related proteins [Mycobacteroides abscessus subsp. abscessus]|uniref:type II toxin-antitoxin system prevent-host-death family antitoxin n=1 Tax=Mycobacteroides abscessus TaxID=36809 RepID=UPI0009A572E2|nr:type II toxin-antitoxin system prevent-host-death family antitoxin [Mycobacteroides abscessus]SLI19293.1 DNA segregation ATPase FtsK/SpoIIIE and related proteins [Mycobacteroides abscessus subsp. abscessus]